MREILTIKVYKYNDEYYESMKDLKEAVTDNKLEEFGLKDACERLTVLENRANLIKILIEHDYDLQIKEANQ